MLLAFLVLHRCHHPAPRLPTARATVTVSCSRVARKMLLNPFTGAGASSAGCRPLAANWPQDPPGLTAASDSIATEPGVVSSTPACVGAGLSPGPWLVWSLQCLRLVTVLENPGSCEGRCIPNCPGKRRFPSAQWEVGTRRASTRTHSPAHSLRPELWGPLPVVGPIVSAVGFLLSLPSSQEGARLLWRGARCSLGCPEAPVGTSCSSWGEGAGQGLLAGPCQACERASTVQTDLVGTWVVRSDWLGERRVWAFEGTGEGSGHPQCRDGEGALWGGRLAPDNTLSRVGDWLKGPQVSLAPQGAGAKVRPWAGASHLLLEGCVGEHGDWVQIKAGRRRQGAAGPCGAESDSLRLPQSSAAAVSLRPSLMF